MSTYNITYRRYRYRKDSVLTANRSATLTKSWNDHFLHIQIIHTDRSRKNIHNGIHCTHFMEMDLIHRYIMGFRFCLGKNLKNSFSIGFCTICHICVVDNLHDLVKATVLVMMVSMPGTPMIMMMFFMIMTVKIPIISMQIFHIMIMILVIMIQQYIKITGIDP